MPASDMRSRREKIFAMLDSPNEQEQLAAVRAMKRTGGMFRDLLAKPEPAEVRKPSARPSWVMDVRGPRTNGTKVDLLAYGDFDHEPLLSAIEEPLLWANCAVRSWDARKDCLHHKAPDPPLFGDPWECLRLPAEPRSQLAYIFEMVRNGDCSHLVLLTDRYAESWTERAAFWLCNIKVYAIHVGDGRHKPLRRLARSTGGMFGYIPDPSLTRFPLDVRALINFVGAA